MDKKSLIGIGVIVVLFAGFAYFSSKEQEKYQREMAAYRAYQDSVAAASRPVVPLTGVPASDSLAGADPAAVAAAGGQLRTAQLGE